MILDYYSSLERSDSGTIPDILSTYVAPDWHWRSYHPFGECSGSASVSDIFWRPFLSSFSSPQRRQDIFFAGLNEIDNFSSVWVVSMGYLIGLFDRPFLGIPASGKLSMFRYCEFNRVESDKIVETAFYFDLPHLMAQGGLSPFSSSRGSGLFHLPPRPHTGLCTEPCDSTETQKTSMAINSMISDLGTWQSDLPLVDELSRTWHSDMLWWGPEGIGATYTIERYAQQHSGPFRAAFSERSNTSHICRVCEGHYGGFFGYPNFSAVHSGAFLGKEPSNLRTEFRVIDIYRRCEDKLAENWIFIDLLHWLYQLGDDVLGRLSRGD